MGSMIAPHVIALLQGGTHACGNRFLADVQMDWAGYLTSLHQVSGLFLKKTNSQHGAVHGNEQIGVQIPHCCLPRINSQCQCIYLLHPRIAIPLLHSGTTCHRTRESRSRCTPRLRRR